MKNSLKTLNSKVELRIRKTDYTQRSKIMQKEDRQDERKIDKQRVKKP